METVINYGIEIGQMISQVLLNNPAESCIALAVAIVAMGIAISRKLVSVR